LKKLLRGSIEVTCKYNAETKKLTSHNCSWWYYEANQKLERPWFSMPVALRDTSLVHRQIKLCISCSLLAMACKTLTSYSFFIRDLGVRRRWQGVWLKLEGPLQWPLQELCCVFWAPWLTYVWYAIL
jgi:hypothetical protein